MVSFHISIFFSIFIYIFVLQHPLPACASGEWGPAKAIRHFNIQPLSHFQAIFETHNLPITINFKCPKQLKFHGKLNSNQYSSISNDHNIISNSSTTNSLDQYVKYEYDEYDFIITFIIQLPHEGQYGIDLYARDPEYQTEKRTMSHCCKYIINYSKPSIIDVVPPPTNNNNNNNNNHLYHDYSFDSPKSNGQQRMISPRNSSNFNESERSLSPRKFHVYVIKSISGRTLESLEEYQDENIV
jgi:hypothetical protein